MKRHIYGSGGDSPHLLAAARRLAVAAARGAAPPPEPGLLECLRRDRERRISAVVDRLSFVASPNGFLTAARAATAIEGAIAAAAAEASQRSASYGGRGRSGDSNRSATQAVSPLRPSTPLVLRPSISTFMQVKIGELRSLLALESRPLASLSLKGLAFEAFRNEWWEVNQRRGRTFEASRGNLSTTKSGWFAVPTDFRSNPPRTVTEISQQKAVSTAGWPGWRWRGGRHRTSFSYLRVCLQGIGVLDLTTDGQLHTEVISYAGAPERTRDATAARASAAFAPRRQSAEKGGRAHVHAARSAASIAAIMAEEAERRPVIEVELLPGNDGFGSGAEVNASLCGLRVCFLRRFMAEVIKYFGPDGLGPVFDVVGSIGGGDGGGKQRGIVSDDEGSVVEGDERCDNDDVVVEVVSGEEDEAMLDSWLVVDDSDNGGVRAGGVDRGISNRRGSSRDAPSATSPGRGGGDDRTPTQQMSPRPKGGDSRESGDDDTGMRVTAVLKDLTVVIPRSTHSREAAAVKCDELYFEVNLRTLLCK